MVLYIAGLMELGWTVTRGGVWTRIAAWPILFHLNGPNKLQSASNKVEGEYDGCKQTLIMKDVLRRTREVGMGICYFKILHVSCDSMQLNMTSPSSIPITAPAIRFIGGKKGNGYIRMWIFVGSVVGHVCNETTGAATEHFHWILSQMLMQLIPFSLSMYSPMLIDSFGQIKRSWWFGSHFVLHFPGSTIQFNNIYNRISTCNPA